MPKKSAKQRKKDKALKESEPAPKPPSLLTRPATTTAAATTSCSDMSGPAETSRLESSSMMGKLPLADRNSVNEPDVPKGEDKGATAIAIPSGNYVEATSTHSSPPHDAASILAALAAKSPARAPSPRPSVSPNRKPSPRPPFSPTSSAPPGSTHALVSSNSAEGRPSSIHSTTAPTLIPRATGRGVSFMPSASQCSPAFESNMEWSMKAHAERPVMDRKASGAFREIAVEDRKGLKAKTSRSSLKVSPEEQGAASDVRSEQLECKEEDPVTEAQIDEMVRKGKIEVGVTPVLPDTVQVSNHAPVQDLQEAERITTTTPDNEGKDISYRGTEPNKSENARDIKAGEVQRGDLGSGFTTATKASKLDTLPGNEIHIHIGGLVRQRRGTLLDAPMETAKGGPPDSADERVLNEVIGRSEDDIERTKVTAFQKTCAVDTKQITKKDIDTKKVNQDVYVPPYKTRRPYTPVALAKHTESRQNLSLSFFASITRHHDVPYASSRRLEARIAWSDPKTLAWVPGRKYIPDWTLEYVARRPEDGVVRKTVRGTLGYMPVVWRFAEWI